MGKLKTEILKGIMALTLVVLVLVAPTYVVGKNTTDTEVQTQIINTNTGDYIIYIKELLNKEFSFAISNEADASEMDLNYIKSEKDEDENNVAFIKTAKYEKLEADAKTYLYVKTGEDVLTTEINLEKAFKQEQMEEVEKTTTRIETEVKTDITKKDEEVNGVKVKVTVGGLKILDESKADFYYGRTKLPAKDYTELVELANKINDEYDEMDMYTKIETAKEFHALYTSLAEKQEWTKVEDKTIMQPEDAKKDEQYVVYLKKVDENKKETIDLKIMTSYREDEEEKIPGRTETKIVKETTKLPITGDSIILFVILAAIILVAIIVFVRMKKLQGKENK